MRYLLFLLLIVFSFESFSQDRTLGVFENTTESYNGYTLFSNDRTTYLVDNCGYIINTWESDYTPGQMTYLLENGNLLRCARVNGQFNGGGVGGAFELYSWDGDLLWSYRLSDNLKQSHHDIEPLPNGNFLAIVWTLMTAEEAIAEGRSYDQDIWMERIIEIEMVGTDEANFVWQWSLEDHLVQDVNPMMPNYGVVADNIGKMDFNYIPESDVKTDWVHFNAIDYNKDLDQIAVSTRNFSEIWIIDHSTTTEEAAKAQGGNSDKGGDILYRYGNPQVYDRGGPEDQIFFNQHNVEWVENNPNYEGQMTVFNNNKGPNSSAIERWTPPVNGYDYEAPSLGHSYGPNEVNWTYSETGFFSSRISSAQVLPNDNVLICSGGVGEFFEVTENKELVWRYINPVTSNFGPLDQGQNSGANSTFRVLRYGPDYPAFTNRDLTPTIKIELNPIDDDCMIHDPVGNNDIETDPSVEMISNLVSEKLEVNSESQFDNVFISNINGELLMQTSLNEGVNRIGLSDLSKGIYLLTIRQKDKVSTYKFVKI